MKNKDSKPWGRQDKQLWKKWGADYHKSVETPVGIGDRRNE